MAPEATAPEAIMMNLSPRWLHLLGFCCVSGLVVAADRSPSPDVQRATWQFREFYLGADDAFAMRDTNEPAPDPSRARRFAQTLRADGSWADVDYQSTARSGWPPATHCTRMTAMATTAGRRDTPAPDRAALLDATHRAFAFWIAHDFQCPNWWYNEIGIPKAIGLTALLLGDEVAPAEYRYATQTSLSRFPIARTGQNKVWLAGNSLMLGLLTGDEAVIRAATSSVRFSRMRLRS